MSPTRQRRGCSYRVDYLHFSAITAISREARQVPRDQRLTTPATTDPTHRRAVRRWIGTVMAVEKLCVERMACGQRIDASVQVTLTTFAPASISTKSTQRDQGR